MWYFWRSTKPESGKLDDGSSITAYSCATSDQMSHLTSQGLSLPHLLNRESISCSAISHHSQGDNRMREKHVCRGSFWTWDTNETLFKHYESLKENALWKTDGSESGNRKPNSLCEQAAVRWPRTWSGLAVPVMLVAIPTVIVLVCKTVENVNQPLHRTNLLG